MTDRSLLWKFLQAIARFLTSTLFDLKVRGLDSIPQHGGVLDDFCCAAFSNQESRT